MIANSITLGVEETSLYLVPTPIGNLEDMTFRAVNVLKSVTTILAEDTRTSRKVCQHYDINTKLQSHHTFNEHKTTEGLVERMGNGEVIALITDAGTPGISDPGYLLVRACVEAGLKIECLPGATAFVPAVVKSGIPSDRFVFEGFLPHKKGKRTKLEAIAQEERTTIVYESPYRLVKSLEMLQEITGSERIVSVSRELTKLFEETKTGPVEEVIAHFKAKDVKGEIVIVIEGKPKSKK